MAYSEEFLRACEVLVSFKNPDLLKHPTRIIKCTKKRNTVRRKRKHFESFDFWYMKKPQIRVSSLLLKKSNHLKQQNKQVPLRNYANQSAEKKQSTILSFSTDFTLQQLFGAKDAQEIERISSFSDFWSQGHLPLIERQQGWIVEMITRKNGYVYKLYRHEKSNLRFRSLKQVKAFICNNTLPKKQGISVRRRKTSRSLAKPIP